MSTNENDEDVLSGPCLCGSVVYEIRGGVGNLSYCHCNMCHKAHGAAFATYAPVGWDAFKFVSGEDKVRRYSSSHDVERTFCSDCGSNLQFTRDDRAGFGLAVGTMDSDPTRRPTAQINTAYNAPWWDLQETPPCFDTHHSQQKT